MYCFATCLCFVLFFHPIRNQKQNLKIHKYSSTSSVLHNLFNQFFIDGQVSFFQLCALINNTKLNILVYMSTCQISPFRQIPRSRNTMSKDVAFHTYCQIAFQKNHANWHSHQQWKRMQASPHPDLP